MKDSSRPQVLLVNQFCGFLCRDLANKLSREFGLVKLVTGNPEGYTFELGVSISKMMPYNRKNFLTRFYSWLGFTLQTYLSHQSSREKIWILVSNPPLVPLFLGSLAIKKKIPYFLIIYDLYPDALNQVNLFKPRSWIFKVWERANKKIFSRAAGIITLSEGMKEGIEKYLPQNINNLLIIPNWFETPSSQYSSSLNPFLEKWKGKLVVLYSGNMGMTHDLESVIAAAQLLNFQSGIQFVFAGEGAKKTKLVKMAVELGLKNIEFLPYQTPENFNFLLQKADIALVSQAVGAEDISVPSKTYTAMGAGLGLIGISSPNSVLDELIQTYKMGYTISPNCPKPLSTTIEELFNNPEKLQKIKRASKEGSLNFSVANLDRYIEIMKPFITHHG